MHLSISHSRIFGLQYSSISTTDLNAAVEFLPPIRECHEDILHDVDYFGEHDNHTIINFVDDSDTPIVTLFFADRTIYSYTADKILTELLDAAIGIIMDRNNAKLLLEMIFEKLVNI